MFVNRHGRKTQARRDEEWRLLVRSITDSDAPPSEADEARFRAYLGDVDSRPRRRRLRWMTRAPNDVDSLRLDRERH
jgi:hypothetical protein